MNYFDYLYLYRPNRQIFTSMMNKFLFFWLFIAFALLLNAQNTPYNGPMPGYNSDTEASIWIQFHKPLKVQLAYASSPLDSTYSEVLEANPAKAYVVVFRLKGLKPDTRYSYRLVSDSLPHEKNIFDFRTQPESGKVFDFSVATGSCSCLRDKSVGKAGRHFNSASGYRIFNAIAETNPDYMLWLGDNIYLRNKEWLSFEGVCHRYTHTRSLPQMQKLLQTTHHFSIWDDHDYGANNGNQFSASKDFALDGFNLFWVNPSTHPTNQRGIYYNYKIGDAEFFLTDDRYFRSPDTVQNNESKRFLGDAQIRWLIESLQNSDANFKIIAIGTQYLNANPEPRKEGYWKDYTTEARYLLDQIKKEKIRGVFFLTGDVHHTVLSKLVSPDFYPIHDLTVSALTSIQNPLFGIKNALKVSGTFVWNHNFAILKFSGNENKRMMQIEIRDKWGVRKWKKTIYADDLRVED